MTASSPLCFRLEPRARRQAHPEQKVRTAFPFANEDCLTPLRSEVNTATRSAEMDLTYIFGRY